METQERSRARRISRRQFLRSSVTAALQARAYAGGTGTMRIGLIGCGGRGTGAAVQALNACPRAKLTAMADAFEDRLGGSLQGVSKEHPDRVDVPAERRFVGMDAYARVMNTDVDLVILATPPGFRPQQFDAAVTAGKHVFMEKPVAVDVPGQKGPY